MSNLSMYDTQSCPSCLSNLKGKPIPEKDRDNYGGKTHFSLIIGKEYIGKYDGVWEWMCPFCNYIEPRFK